MNKFKHINGTYGRYQQGLASFEDSIEYLEEIMLRHGVYDKPEIKAEIEKFKLIHKLKTGKLGKLIWADHT